MLPVGARTDRPDYDHAEGVTLRLFGLADGHDSVTRVARPSGGEAVFRVTRAGDRVRAEVTGDAPAAWGLALGLGAPVAASGSVLEVPAT